MRVYVCLAALALFGCSQQKPSSVELATACIYSEVPNGQKVSAERARQAVRNCSEQLDAWSKDSIAHALKRPFNSADREMTDAFAKHRAAGQEYWLTHLSDEIKPSSYRL